MEDEIKILPVYGCILSLGEIEFGLLVRFPAFFIEFAHQRAVAILKMAGQAIPAGKGRGGGGLSRHIGGRLGLAGQAAQQGEAEQYFSHWVAFFWVIVR